MLFVIFSMWAASTVHFTALLRRDPNNKMARIHRAKAQYNLVGMCVSRTLHVYNYVTLHVYMSRYMCIRSYYVHVSHYHLHVFMPLATISRKPLSFTGGIKITLDWGRGVKPVMQGYYA